jgi:hypothetical protein
MEAPGQIAIAELKNRKVRKQVVQGAADLGVVGGASHARRVNTGCVGGEDP